MYGHHMWQRPKVHWTTSAAEHPRRRSHWPHAPRTEISSTTRQGLARKPRHQGSLLLHLPLRSLVTRRWTSLRSMSKPTTRSSAFGTVVSAALTERRMSQHDLAEAVGKSPAYTNQTITGRKSASPQWVNLVS